MLTVEVLWPSPIPCLQVGNRAVLNLDETAGRAGIRVANGGKAPVDLFLRGCDESYRFELAGGKETIREIQCEAIDKLVLDVQGSGLHGTVEQRGAIALKAGLHPLKVQFFQKTGGVDMSIAVQIPGMTKQPVPDGMLFYQ